ncbi:uncharacterized protein LTR77_006323 [Saxophila tyrrhenica]|uniref:tripeptidyl-peptidase II n=1 Tax=Saxophila tyrrhenica TaxID=1690608 RepID=A0AAV9PB13_9PEZI|nr:hypothetical protein LTR77_006323 [Saxophila tyrrhenica]
MYFYKLSLSLCAIGIAGTTALPPRVRSDYAVKERHPVPFNWVESGPAPREQNIHLQIGLKQSNEGQIEKHLVETSDPKHERYGQHLSLADVHNMVKPSEETLELVSAWLEDHGIREYVHNPSKDWVSVMMPIEKAEELLQTKYSTYKNWNGAEVSRAPEWSLPQHLHEHIDVVQPTTSFFRASPQTYQPLMDDANAVHQWWEQSGAARYTETDDEASGASISKICNISFTTPKCIRTLYGTIDYKPQVPGKNKIGITNYLNETSKRSDVAKFLRNFRPAAAKAAHEFEIIQIANGNNDQGPYTAEQIEDGKNIEGNLDAEQALSIGWPTPLIAWNTGGSPPFKPDANTPTDTNEPYNVWLNYVLGQDDLPQVISTSYGDDEQTVPESYARRACHGFAQLGARGISVFFSSGDSGVGANGTCFSNDGKHTHQFIPSFPAGCPWVTAVGGTKGFEPEVAVSRYGSGGGFSNYFRTPHYQKSTVQAYIESLNGEYNGLYNKQGRGYPDVAAQGNHDVIVWAGNITTVGGTSASSPSFAAVIALVNDALIAAGKPTLGFLNPWLYSGAYEALTDVVSGSAIGCNTAGFPAQGGWDAVTGWGTPNFGKLVDVAMSK